MKILKPRAKIITKFYCSFLIRLKIFRHWYKRFLKERYSKKQFEDILSQAPKLANQHRINTNHKILCRCEILSNSFKNPFKKEFKKEMIIEYDCQDCNKSWFNYKYI